MVCSAFLSQASTPTLQTPTTPLKSFPWSPVHLTISSIDSQWLVKHQQVLILFPPLFPSPTFENWYPKSFGMTLFTYTFPITHSSTSSCFVTEVLMSCGTVLWYSAQKWDTRFQPLPCYAKPDTSSPCQSSHCSWEELGLMQVSVPALTSLTMQTVTKGSSLTREYIVVASAPVELSPAGQCC